MLPLLSRVLRSTALMGALVAPALSWAQADLTPFTLHYTPANTNARYTVPVGVSVSPDGEQLRVKVTPVGGAQGGRMSFGTYPWWVSVADFSAGNKLGSAHSGDRYRGHGALVSPKGRQYTMGTRVPGSSNVYALTPVAMSGIVRGYPGTWTGTLSGTLTTDGSIGTLKAAQIVDFDVQIDGVQPVGAP